MADSILFDSNYIMSMACGLANPEPLDSIFGSSDFSTVNSVKKALQDGSVKEKLAGILCILIQEEAFARSSPFTLKSDKIEAKNQPARFGFPSSQGWLSFINLLNKVRNTPIITPLEQGTPEQIQDVIPDFSDHASLKSLGTSNISLVYNTVISDTQAIDLFAFDTPRPALGNFLVYVPEALKAIAESTVHEIGKFADEFTPAKKIKTISDIQPQLLAKAVAKSLQLIRREADASADKIGYLSSTVSRLKASIANDAIAATNDPKSPFYNKSTKEIINLVSVDILPMFGKKVSGIPNEISLELYSVLTEFEASTKSSVETLNILRNTDDEIPLDNLINNYNGMTATISKLLNEVNDVMDVNVEQLKTYGFVLKGDTFEFAPTARPYNAIRKNPVPILSLPVQTVFGMCVSAVLITACVLVIVRALKAEIYEFIATLKAVDASTAKKIAEVECDQDPKSANCTKAKAEAAVAAANAEAWDSKAQDASKDSPLNNIFEIFNSAAQQIPTILNIGLWVLGLGATAVAAKKLWDYSNKQD